MFQKYCRNEGTRGFRSSGSSLSWAQAAWATGPRRTLRPAVIPRLIDLPFAAGANFAGIKTFEKRAGPVGRPTKVRARSLATDPHLGSCNASSAFEPAQVPGGREAALTLRPASAPPAWAARLVAADHSLASPILLLYQQRQVRPRIDHRCLAAWTC